MELLRERQRDELNATKIIEKVSVHSKCWDSAKYDDVDNTTNDEDDDNGSNGDDDIKCLLL